MGEWQAIRKDDPENLPLAIRAVCYDFHTAKIEGAKVIAAGISPKSEFRQ